MLRRRLPVVLTAVIVLAAVVVSVAVFRVERWSLPNVKASIAESVPAVYSSTVALLPQSPPDIQPTHDSSTQPEASGAIPEASGAIPEASGAIPEASRATPTASGDIYDGPNYLSTSGSKLVDSTGKEVTITGIAWFGMETGTYAPHGLWARKWEDMLDQVAKLGYNTIRLPYSNQLFDAGSVPEGINYELNPDLTGLTGLQIMDKIVQGAGKRGLKIILDRHRPDANSQSNLWYTDKYSEKRWIDDWTMLAARYKDNDAVIGADLHNEPHGEATWGTDDPKTDWRLAAERAGNAILDVNPNWLIVVEGIERFGDDSYWWGGNLKGVAEKPVRLKVPDRLVYSAHDYGPGVYNQSWFIDSAFPSNLPKLWDSHWGYIAKQGVAPVLMGEFGGRSVGKDTEGVWQKSLMKYLKENGVSYTYWTLNPNSGDTGGILTDDWTTVNQAKQDLLSTYLAPPIAVTSGQTLSLEATPGKQGF